MDLLRTVNGESVGDWVRFPNHDAALTNILLIISQSVLLCQGRNVTSSSLQRREAHKTEGVCKIKP